MGWAKTLHPLQQFCDQFLLHSLLVPLYAFVLPRLLFKNWSNDEISGWSNRFCKNHRYTSHNFQIVPKYAQNEFRLPRHLICMWVSSLGMLAIFWDIATISTCISPCFNYFDRKPCGLTNRKFYLSISKEMIVQFWYGATGNNEQMIVQFWYGATGINDPGIRMKRLRNIEKMCDFKCYESLNAAQIVMRASDEYCNVMSHFGIKQWASSNTTSP